MYVIIINRPLFFICQTSFEKENKIFISFIDVRKNFVEKNIKSESLIENIKNY